VGPDTTSVSGPGHRQALGPTSPAFSTRGALARRRTARSDAASALSLQVTLVSRVLVWAAGLIALALFSKNGAYIAAFDRFHLTEPFHSSVANALIAPAARWDSVWYLSIAHLGYYSRQSTAFFPLYPLLIRGGTALFGSAILIGALISLAAMLAGLVILYRLVALDIGEREARVTVALLAFFPTAFFLSAVYTESLYLALSVGAIYSARLDRWAWAAFFGALAAATRSSGILILIPLALLYFYGPRAHTRAKIATRWSDPRYGPARSIVWLGLVPLGTVTYMAYLAFAHNDPLAPFQAENVYWGRQFAGLFGAVWEAAKAVPGEVRGAWTGRSPAWGLHDPLTVADHGLIDLGFLLFALVGLTASWRRVPFAYFAYTLALLAEGLSYPTQADALESLPRYVLVMFPIFIGWAVLLAPRRNMRVAALALSAVLLVVFSGLWSTWAWVA
jgi:hypothetical protein